MTKTLPVFEEFINPLEGKQFERDIYGLVPAYIEGARDKFASLVDWSAIDNIVTHKRLAKSHFSLAKKAIAVPWTRYSDLYTDIYGEYLSIRADDLNKELSSGATMVLVHIDDFHQPLRDVCAMLERRLRNRFFADVFACCRPVPGFFAHWDPDDNFIAQIIGKKHWKIMRPTHPHPLGSMQAHESPPSEIYWQGILEPGDLLYVPHGWWHEVSAVDGPSLHVSFTTFPITGLDVSKEIVRALEDQQLFRAGIPIFHSTEQQQEYFQRLVGEILQAARGFDFESYLSAKAPGQRLLKLPWGALDTAK